MEILYTITTLHDFIQKNQQEKKAFFADADLKDEHLDNMNINNI